MNHGLQGTLEGYAAFDALWHQLLSLATFLEVAITGTLLLGHGAHRPHAPIRFIGAPLIQLDLPGGFLGPGEHAADHNTVRPSHNGLGDIAGITDTAVGDDGNIGVL